MNAQLSGEISPLFKNVAQIAVRLVNRAEDFVIGVLPAKALSESLRSYKDGQAIIQNKKKFLELINIVGSHADQIASRYSRAVADERPLDTLSRRDLLTTQNLSGFPWTTVTAPVRVQIARVELSTAYIQAQRRERGFLSLLRNAPGVIHREHESTVREAASAMQELLTLVQADLSAAISRMPDHVLQITVIAKIAQARDLEGLPPGRYRDAIVSGHDEADADKVAYDTATYDLYSLDRGAAFLKRIKKNAPSVRL